MAYEAIILEKEDGVATRTFNRPEKLNALNQTLTFEAADALEKIGKDDEVKAVIITGAGRGFCTGMDLTAERLPQVKRELIMAPIGHYGWLVQKVEGCPKPVIAAVNGIAAGAGLSMALCCDIRIASDNARFSAIFTRRGLVPDCGATYYLPRLVGVAKALELMWTGDIIDARQAESIGLVSQVVPADELMKMTKEFARRLARGPSLAVELTKRMVYLGLSTNNAAAQMLVEAHAQSVCGQSEDAAEARQAFFEKREPQFKGR